MTYEKQEWKCGDVVTADKLNHIEDGIANCGGGSEPLIVTFTQEEEPCSGDGTLTRTKKTYSHSWKEIHDSLENGIPVYIKMTAQQEGVVATFLDPVAAAMTNNSALYHLETVSDLTSHDFPNPTDKEWYEGNCK